MDACAMASPTDAACIETLQVTFEAEEMGSPMGTLVGRSLLAAFAFVLFAAKFDSPCSEFVVLEVEG